MKKEVFFLTLGVLIVSCVASEDQVDDGTDDGSECNRNNRARSIFGAPNYKPTLQTNPVTKAYTTVKGISVSGLREYNSDDRFPARGIFHATTFRAQDNDNAREGDGSGGYFGVQWRPKRDQLLYSVWDRKQNKDRFALPFHSNCKRNCNDCGKEDTTGTQCKFQLPNRLEENDELKLTIEREEVQSVEYEGKTHNGQQLDNKMYNGHVWKVSVEYVSGPNKETFMTDQFGLGKDEVFTLGRILFTENDLEVGGTVSSGGIVRLNMFNEPIGCTPCDAFKFEVERSGPYIQQAIDSSDIPKIEEGNTGIGYNKNGNTCEAFDIKSCEFGKLIFQTGPDYTPTRKSNRKQKEKLYWMTEEGEKFARDISYCDGE